MVKLRQTPIDESQLLLLVIDHYVVWLHVPVHDPVRVRIVQRLEKLEDVIPVSQSGLKKDGCISEFGKTTGLQGVEPNNSTK